MRADGAGRSTGAIMQRLWRQEAGTAAELAQEAGRDDGGALATLMDTRGETQAAGRWCWVVCNNVRRSLDGRRWAAMPSKGLP